MVAGAFSGGVGIYVFYALQPYLLELWGDSEAYGIAGIAAAVVAGSQIVGGAVAGRVRSLFRRRTSALLLAESLGAVVLIMVGLFATFWVAVVLIVATSLLWAMVVPIRQAYLNDLIPSEQRATILSFDSLVSSAGGVVAQPILGRAADVWGYPASYLIGGAISALTVPFLALSRRQHSPADLGAREPTADAT
jgi:MFS family permease